MDIELPSGCNIFVQSDKFTNYDNGLMTDYYIYNGQVIKGISTTANSYSSSDCFNGSLVYKPELQIFYQFFSMVLIGAVFVLLYKIFFERFFK